MRQRESYNGLGGWLIIVGIGIVFSPFKMISEILPTYITLFSDGSWEVITNSESINYNVFLPPILIFEIMINIILICASFYRIYLFFSKHYRFPEIYIWVFIATILFLIIDSWLISLVFPDMVTFDKDTIGGIIKVIAGGIIWIPYMKKSIRVENTFIKYKPNSIIKKIEQSFNTKLSDYD